ncbi:DUF7526 family protein [Halobaculum magnesiiphilum]|uniref:Uncharacterized protein n=1 Tax=Halobaculum magnesiiphilum TaxID=1017351 RepID=A0A8T8WHW2_9EURY|nr:hypothetical protein [Halobaculum magnesiiphilum]QZP39427.1 hypothetical protein K6T50_17730 [Halobaculum magnesiiphilum]
MTETITIEVVHAVGPEELDEADLQPALREIADAHHVLVGRRGGRQSWLDRIRAFLAREPVEAVTVVTDEPASEGAEVTLRVEETDIAGVYVATAT